jgi:ADP-ribose pyrophosphatase
LERPVSETISIMKERHGVVLAQRTAFAGRILSVAADRVRLPNGNEATMEVVRHVGSVVLLPMPDEDHIVLVKQYRYAIDRWIWELPAGCLNPGEEPAAAASRECQEETGFVPTRLERLAGFYPTPGYCDEFMHFFRLTGLSTPGAGAPVAHQDEDEDLRPRTFAVDQVRRMIRSGEILDLKTAMGLALI